MIYLFSSILLNSYLAIAFAVFKKLNIDFFQAIVFNYAACVITGSLLMGNFPVTRSIISDPSMPWGILMGVLFISVFNLIGYSTNRTGITITQTANKLSMVIPVLVSYFLYHESLTLLKGAGICLALLAVILVSQQEHKEAAATSGRGLLFVLPLVLFVSSGLIDTLTKYVQFMYLKNEDQSNTYLICGFLTAFIAGFIILLIQLLRGKRTFQMKAVVAGILLGIPNYFSIYFLVKALQHNQLSSSAIIPLNNIGVLLLVTVFGVFVFNEKLSRINYVGLFLTLVAMLLIFIGDING